ncbi:hypothetical protein LY78DRAFT_654095 [Colletotrichum sublineola]|nr:hypothetical protein LY78DRAFT_654095 [Colletotrichum sublineola]
MQCYHVSSQNPSSLVGGEGDGVVMAARSTKPDPISVLDVRFRSAEGLSPPHLLHLHIPSWKTVTAPWGGLAEHVHLRVAGRVFFGRGGGRGRSSLSAGVPDGGWTVFLFRPHTTTAGSSLSETGHLPLRTSILLLSSLAEVFLVSANTT